MDRRDFYFKQLVSEGDLDEVCDLIEQADRDYVVDTGLVGVYTGLAVAEAGIPNLTVQVSGGSAYDQTGQRTAVVGAQIVPVNVDKDNVSTEVAGGGNSKIISVFIKFKRVLSNPKNDGNNVVVQYNRDESFEFIVEQSDEGVDPTAPALKSDALLLADIERAFGQTVIEDSNINTSRRQWAISVEAGDFSIGTGRVEEAFQAVVTQFDALEGDLEGNGGAAMIGYNGGPAWVDGTTNPATTVEAQLDKIVTDLATGAGTAKVRSALIDAGGGYSLTAGTLASQLLTLITKHKDHETDATAAHAASAISNTAAGNIAATTVQNAINELDTEKGGLGTVNTWTTTNNWSSTANFNGSANFFGSIFFGGSPVTFQGGSTVNAVDAFDFSGAARVLTSLELVAASFKARTHSGSGSANNTTIEIITGASDTTGQGTTTLATIALSAQEIVGVIVLGLSVENSAIDVSKYGCKVIAGLAYRAGAGVQAPVYIFGGAGTNLARTSTNLADDSFKLQNSGNNLLVIADHNVNSTSFMAGCYVLVLRVKP